MKRYIDRMNVNRIVSVCSRSVGCPKKRWKDVLYLVNCRPTSLFLGRKKEEEEEERRQIKVGDSKQFQFNSK